MTLRWRRISPDPSVNGDARRDGLAARVDGVTVAYDELVALDEVTFDVPEGRIVGLVGPNGAGKTTLFKTIVGLLEPDRGTVQVRGRDPNERGRQRDVAYVPQEGDLDPTYPVHVLDVVLMGRYGHVGWGRRLRDEDREAARGALDRVGIEGLADRPFLNLSGGQRQRVFLARALAQDASLFLLDEPFTGVDASTQEIILDVLRGLKREGASLVVATHGLGTIRHFCDDVVLLNREVVAAGPVEEAFSAENLKRAFGGRLVLLGDAAMAERRA